MKVVVCDDSMEDLKKIKGLLTKYSETNKNVRLGTQYFASSADCITRYKQTHRAISIFLI